MERELLYPPLLLNHLVWCLRALPSPNLNTTQVTLKPAVQQVPAVVKAQQPLKPEVAVSVFIPPAVGAAIGHYRSVAKESTSSKSPVVVSAPVVVLPPSLATPPVVVPVTTVPSAELSEGILPPPPKPQHDVEASASSSRRNRRSPTPPPPRSKSRSKSSDQERVLEPPPKKFKKGKGAKKRLRDEEYWNARLEGCKPNFSQFRSGHPKE